MIYFVLIPETNTVKIGFTTNIEQRLLVLQTGSPYDLKLIKVVRGSPRIEKQLHKKFAEYKVRGEWFIWNDVIKDYVEKLTPYREGDDENTNFIRYPNEFAVLKIGNKRINMNLGNHWSRKCKGVDVKLLIDMVDRENINTYSVVVDKKTRADITKTLNISDSQITLCLKNLVTNNIIARINRGSYMINPSVLWQGNEKQFNKKVDEWFKLNS